jgi:alkylation response protein AidB-like acyl-CoA dehydrogenase
MRGVLLAGEQRRVNAVGSAGYTPVASFADPGLGRFRDQVEQWFRHVAEPALSGSDYASLPEAQQLIERRNWDNMLCSAGFGAISWPVEYGGLGLGPIEEYVFYMRAAQARAPDLLNLIGLDLAGPAIIAVGSESQRATYLPRILDCSQLWCEGFSEPESGSDMASVSTRATPCDGGYLVTGQKIWTSLASHADRCYMLVRTSEDLPRHHNLSILLVDMRQPGVDVRPIRQITGMAEFSEVFLDGVFVAASDRLGNENEGWHLATLAGFRDSRRAFDSLRRFVQIRNAADRLRHCLPPGVRELQDLHHRLELLRWHIARIVESTAQGRGIAGATATLRLVWSRLWQDISEAGLRSSCRQHEHVWRLEYLQTRMASIAGGTEQIQRNIIADRILQLPR